MRSNEFVFFVVEVVQGENIHAVSSRPSFRLKAGEGGYVVKEQVVFAQLNLGGSPDLKSLFRRKCIKSPPLSNCGDRPLYPFRFLDS